MEGSSDGDKPLRPLLPAGNTQGRTAVNRISAPSIPKRAATIAACIACRQRKSKRKYNALVEEQDAPSPHQELLNLLRTVSDVEAQDIFKRVRAGQHTEAILNRIKEGNLLLQLHLKPESRLRFDFPYSPDMPEYVTVDVDNPYLDSLAYEFSIPGRDLDTRQRNLANDTTHLNRYLKPYHAAVLEEPLLSDIKISPWTSISSDESLLRSLMHHYLLHQYSFWPFFHKDCFLQDLSSRSKQFCSSLLVNVILADACHGLPRIECRSEPWNPHSLTYRFFAEAKRLWELEVHRVTITTVQATLIMQMILNADGFDKVSWTYLGEALKMYQDMKLFEMSEMSDTRLQISRELTAWALFNWHTIFTFHFFIPPLTPDAPNFMPPDPSKDSGWYGELYVRYPGDDAAVPINQTQVLYAICKFRRILNDITKASADARPEPILLHQTKKLYARLRQWFEELPACLNANNIVLPVHLKIHPHYCNVLIMLFAPHIDTTEITSGSFFNPINNSTALSFSPRKIVLDAKAQYETLVRLYYVRHSFETFDPMLVQFISVLGFHRC